VGDADVVAAVSAPPATVCDAFARAPGAAGAEPLGARSAESAGVRVRFADGVRLDLYCVAPPRFAVALWRATGSAAHVAQVAERLAARGVVLDGDLVRDAAGAVVPVEDEADLYGLAGLAFVVPELREGMGEVDDAARGLVPELVEPADLRGALHCHTTYSDGSAGVFEMAEAARTHGWSYLGITDHSQAASYAGGLSPAAVRQQHGEIDRVNDDYARAGVAMRVLKGIEADILGDGALDYDDATLALFDFVIGSVHSRFNLGEAEMTARVCRAVANPFLTVLGHPTGRLLLQREAYALDVRAVLEAAAEHGAAVEINAHPVRLDLDWRHGADVRRLGLTVEIGPDAHAPAGLGDVEHGVAAARKAGVGPGAVLNARGADAVLAFARAKREGRPTAAPRGGGGDA
jgi:DNA polymerase (family 10)